MAIKKDSRLVLELVEKYLKVLEKKKVPIWRAYLFGSYVKNNFNENSDIDLAFFWDKKDIDGFDEDSKLMKLTPQVDLRIETHSFAKTDFYDPSPYIKEILKTGKRIL